MEQQLISLITSLLPESAGYLGDDAAVLELESAKYLFSVDNLVEGLHFSEEYFSPYDIGWKSIAVNISDIAAMGGEPLFVLVGLSLANKIIKKDFWVTEFYRGLQDCAKQFGQIKVIGGDITSSPEQTMISISIIGRAFQAKHVLTRRDAKPGDKICVTGKFGNSASFLKRLKNNLVISDFVESEWALKSSDIQYHLRPNPRIQEALNIWDSNNSGALMDSSDGLAQALIEMSEKSQMDFEIDTRCIPRDKHIDLETALYGGEDYELVACLKEVPVGYKIIGIVKNSSPEPKVLDIATDRLLTKDKIFNHF